MGNAELGKGEKGKAKIEHPRFANARLTIDKKLLL